MKFDPRYKYCVLIISFFPSFYVYQTSGAEIDESLAYESMSVSNLANVMLEAMPKPATDEQITQLAKLIRSRTDQNQVSELIVSAIIARSHPSVGPLKVALKINPEIFRIQSSEHIEKWLKLKKYSAIRFMLNFWRDERNLGDNPAIAIVPEHEILEIFDSREFWGFTIQDSGAVASTFLRELDLTDRWKDQKAVIRAVKNIYEFIEKSDNGDPYNVRKLIELMLSKRELEFSK